MDAAVRIVGLAELRRALRAAAQGTEKELQRAGKRAAALIAVEAQAAFDRGTGRAAGSIRPRARQLMAEVAGGGVRAPHFGVREFGGWVPRRGFKGLRSRSRAVTRNPKSGKPAATHMKPYRGPIRGVPWPEDEAGYGLFPAGRAMYPRSVDYYADAIGELVADAFPER